MKRVQHCQPYCPVQCPEYQIAKKMIYKTIVAVLSLQLGSCHEKYTFTWDTQLVSRAVARLQSDPATRPRSLFWAGAISSLWPTRVSSRCLSGSMGLGGEGSEVFQKISSVICCVVMVSRVGWGQDLQDSNSTGGAPHWSGSTALESLRSAFSSRPASGQASLLPSTLHTVQGYQSSEL